MLVVLNTSSGRLSDPAQQEILRKSFERAGLQPRFAEAPDAAAIRAAIERDTSEVVVACGGDGTIGAAAACLSRTDRVLGVVPGGTLNHFAKDLGIPSDFAGAVELLTGGATRAVDVAEVNGHSFINNSSLGLYPQIVRERAKIQRRGVRKWLAFAGAITSTLLEWPLVKVSLEVDGRAARRLTPFVFVGNNLYEMEGLRIGSRRRLDEGRLCLCVARVMSRFGLARMAVRGLTGGLRNTHDLEVVCAKEAWVKTSGTVDVALDGEVTQLHSPLHYTIRPGALRVIAP